MNASYNTSNIEPFILTLRGQRVILDSDLSTLCGVPTKALNQAIKRNRKRFPPDFLFQLNPKEKEEVVTICDHLQSLKFSPSCPYAFTEHGALMAANVLNSSRAISMSVYVIRAFVRIREVVTVSHLFEKKFALIEKTLLEHDQTLREIILKIRPLLLPAIEKPKRRIGFRES